MINKLSVLATEQLIKHNTISDDEKELYEYGMFILISYFFYSLFTIACGVALDCIGGSIVFYFTFQIIRRYAGGYHASSETRCEVMSMFSILAVIVLIRLSKTYNYQIALIIITALSAICIFILCPLDTQEKPLTKKEFKHFRRCSLLVLMIVSVVIILSIVFNIRFLVYPTCLSLILEGILLITGTIKKQFLKRKNAK
jgi:accessory gene regulator B